MYLANVRKSWSSFMAMESAGGILLIAAAILAMLFANSPFADFYHDTLHLNISILAGDIGFSQSLHHWINDGLMAIFFFLVGLEIKREVMQGQLNSVNKAMLPVIAAIGGMIAPAVIYATINTGNDHNMRGWAIPTATDIAFALGILSLLGKRVPLALKVLLTAIAVIDDMGAVIIIALFYTTSLSYTALGFSAAMLVILFLMNRFNVYRIAPYVIVGFALWASVLESGVHATLAGVLTAMFIPFKSHEDKEAIGHTLEHKLHGYVAFGVMPLFAFANAGLDFRGLSLDSLSTPLTLGIILGLFFGKQIGVFGTIYLADKIGFARKPSTTTWAQIYGLALLCGIGFTMSLFIGTLAFRSNAELIPVQLGIMTGSFLSAVLGYFILSRNPTKE